MERFIEYGLLLVAVAIIIYTALMLLWAKSATTLAPRVDFNSCDKHGLYQTKHAIVMQLPDEFEADKGLIHEFPECPFCFEEKMKKAEDTIKAQK